MDNRADPVEILARVSERDGKQRAFDVWMDKAGKAGWTVVVESKSTDQPGSECGVVNIEGLRYRIHHDRHVRQRVGILPPGKHAIAAALDLAGGSSDEGITWTWEFDHAAWAEPILA